MQEITSVNNQLVKDIVKLQQKKYRDKENSFLLEGYKPIKEAFDAGIQLEQVFVLKEKADKYSFLGNSLILTNEIILKKISTTDTPPEVVGVGVQKHSQLSDLKGKNKLVLLENIRDLGNLGTILRSAVAFGAEGIILYGTSADIYNPKCVRATVGNLWKLPVVYADNLENLFDSYQRIATLPHSNKCLKEFVTQEKILLMFGSEADGLSDKLIRYSNESVKIEMSRTVESLNLSVSCSVLMYELFVNK